MFILDDIPAEFFELEASELHRIFRGPTLLRKKGHGTRWIFISTLLHGNETTGLGALQELLARTNLPCSVLAFIGNIEAAKEGLRNMPNQPDFNRIWSDDTSQSMPWVQSLLKEVLAHQPIATIDIHNTTGISEPYSLISHLNSEHMYLAGLFSKKVVHFREPHSTLVSALGNHMPAVVLECGPSESDEDRHKMVVEYIDQVMHLKELGKTELTDPTFYIYESFARIFVKGDVGFGDTNCALNLDSKLDLHNMKNIKAGDVWGDINLGVEFYAKDSSGVDITKEYFDLSNHKVRVIKDFMASLITPNAKAAKEDCLCYMMKCVNHSSVSK